MEIDSSILVPITYLSKTSITNHISVYNKENTLTKFTTTKFKEAGVLVGTRIFRIK